MSSRFLGKNRATIAELYGKFSSYRDFSQDSIGHWLTYFKPNHRSLALKVLKETIYLNEASIHSAYRSIYTQIISLRNGDLTNLYVAPFGWAGSSGEGMRYFFKLAVREIDPDIESRLIGLSEITPKLLGIPRERKPAVLFVDDIAGTGDEAIDAWKGEPTEEFPERIPLQELVPPQVDIYLVVPVAFLSAIDRVKKETNGRIQVWPKILLTNKHKLLFKENKSFSKKEKDILKDYCDSVGSKKPYGHKDTSAMVVFEHNCPDNTISILWDRTPSWWGLFPRA